MRRRLLIIAALLGVLGVQSVVFGQARFTVLNALATYVNASNVLTEVSAANPLPVSVVQTLGGSSSTGTIVALANMQTGSVGCTNGSTDDTLFTYTLPASAMSVNGKAVRVTAWGTTANTGNSRAVRVFFGSSSTTPINGVITNGTWHNVTTVIRTGAATQAMSTAHNDSLGNNSVSRVATPSETLSGSVIIKVTGNCTAVNDLVGTAFYVEFLN